MTNASRTMAVAMTMLAIDTFGYAVVLPILPFAARTDRLPFWSIGLIFGTYSACQLVAAPVLGRLSDRHGRRRLLLACLAGSAVGFAILVGNQSAWALFASRLIDGLSAGNVAILYAMVFDLDPGPQFGARTGTLSMALGGGLIAGIGASSFVASGGIRLAAGIALLGTVLNGVVAAYLLRGNQPRIAGKENRAMPAVLAMPGIAATWLAAVLAAASQAGFLLVAPVLFVTFLRFPLAEAIRLLTILLVAAAVIEVVAVPWIMRRLHARSSARAGFILAALGGAGIACASGSVLTVIASGVLLVGAVVLMPSITALWSTRSLKPGTEGVLMGLNASGASAGQMVGPLATYAAWSLNVRGAGIVLAALACLGLSSIRWMSP